MSESPPLPDKHEPTPRTDALLADVLARSHRSDITLKAEVEMTEHARQLERELAAAKGAFNDIAKEGLKRADEADTLRSSTAPNDLPRIEAALAITAWAENKPGLLAHRPDRPPVGPPENISFQIRELRGLLKKAVGL